MHIDQSVIDSLVAAPAEGLNVEVKRWIDPDSNAGIEKIVKAALALRNRNGGHLVIGFEDDTPLPHLGGAPADVRSAFHLDKVQGLVSRYASELFEIGVGFSARDGIEYPVIVVPPGVRTPVAAKRGLDDGGKKLIKPGAVYFRTLSSNGTPSSAEARPQDWREIVEICFDNRDADIGRFLRRHLGGGEIARFMSALQEIGVVAGLPSAPTLRVRCEALLEDGEARYRAAIQSRTLDAEGQRLASAGAWSVALVIDPPKGDARPDRTFASIIAASNPKLTGWPVWLDASSSSNEENRPRVISGALEALVVSISLGRSHHLDFERLDPKGEFFLRRVLQDDAVPGKVTPGTCLDPIIAILRVAEAIAVGIAFARALGWAPDQTRLGFAFRWQGLSGRQLYRWADPFSTMEGGRAHDDTVTTFTELALDTAPSAIAPFVSHVTQDLFVLFDGTSVATGTVEDWVQRLIERRLN